MIDHNTLQTTSHHFKHFKPSIGFMTYALQHDKRAPQARSWDAPRPFGTLVFPSWELRSKIRTVWSVRGNGALPRRAEGGRPGLHLSLCGARLSMLGRMR